MRIAFTFVLTLIATYCVAGCAHVERSSPSVIGEYRALDDRSIIVLGGDGTYTVEDRTQEVGFELLVQGGRWTQERDRVILSWTDLSKEKLQSIRSIVYTFTVEDSGVILQLSEGQHLPEGMLQNPMGVQICKTYRKEPNKTPPATTGSYAPSRV